MPKPDPYAVIRRAILNTVYNLREQADRIGATNMRAALDVSMKPLVKAEKRDADAKSGKARARQRRATAPAGSAYDQRFLRDLKIAPLDAPLDAPPGRSLGGDLG